MANGDLWGIREAMRMSVGYMYVSRDRTGAASFTWNISCYWRVEYPYKELNDVHDIQQLTVLLEFIEFVSDHEKAKMKKKEKSSDPVPIAVSQNYPLNGPKNFHKLIWKCPP